MEGGKMNETNNNIDWAAFASPYWRPTTGEQHRVVLAYWRQESRVFDKDKTDKTEKLVLVFDVLKVDGEEFAQGQRQFVTAAVSFAQAVRPIIERALSRNEEAIHIGLTYDKEKKYSLFDLYEPPQKKYIGLKE